MPIKTKELEIVEIGAEEGVDLGSGIKDSLVPNVVLKGELFHPSMLCKWTTSFVDSAWVIRK